MSDDISELPIYENPPQHERVRGLICADDQGQIQVIAPEQALVDPRPIEAATARALRSMQAEQSVTVSAIPGYYGLRSVVHSDLKSRDNLALATETPGRYVRATGNQLKQLCLVHASFDAEFCEQLRGTPQCPDNDEADIVRAVESFTARRVEAQTPRHGGAFGLRSGDLGVARAGQSIFGLGLPKRMGISVGPRPTRSRGGGQRGRDRLRSPWHGAPIPFRRPAYPGGGRSRSITNLRREVAAPHWAG